MNLDGVGCNVNLDRKWWHLGHLTLYRKSKRNSFLSTQQHICVTDQRNSIPEHLDKGKISTKVRIKWWVQSISYYYMTRMWWKKCKKYTEENPIGNDDGLGEKNREIRERVSYMKMKRLCSGWGSRQQRGGHWGLGGTREQGRQQKTLAQNQMSLFVIPPAMFGRFFFSKGNRLKENKIRTPVKPWKREINYIYCYFSTQHLLLLFQKRNSQ